MKNLKKLLAVALSLAILLTLSVPVLAAEKTAGEKLEILGVMIGGGDGVTPAYLAEATTRAQGAIILLRLIGKYEEAGAYAGTANFGDVVGNEWFAVYTAYLKANPAVGFIGYPDGTFQPKKIMTGEEFLKVLLTALGYIQDTDYTWAQVAQKAADLGIAYPKDAKKAITNGDAADLILATLQAQKKDGKVLVDTLIASGAISSADANAAGLISELAILSAVPTGADEVTVTFNKAADDSAAIAVKSGLMSIFVNKTWNAAKTQVVLKRSNNIVFAAGTYEVTIGALKANVKFEKEVAQAVVIDKTTTRANGMETFEVKLKNQYGKDMSTVGQNFTATAFNENAVSVVTVTPNGNNKFDLTTDANTKENHIILVTVMHHETTLIGQAKLTAVNASKVTTFAMTEVVLPKDADKVNVNHTDVEIKYDAYDQYGNKMTLKSLAKANDADGLTFISSNAAIINVNDLKFDANGKLLLTKSLTSGSVTLSVLVNSAGVVTSLPVTVYDPAKVDKVVIGDALKEVVVDETTEISYVAFDQFGNELTKKAANINLTDLTFSQVISAGNLVFDISKDGVLTVKPLGTGKNTATVYYSWKNKLLGSFTLNIWAKAVPTNIDTVSANGGIELGATQNIAASAIKVLDQYGREYAKVVAGNPALTTDDFTWAANPATGGKVNNPVAAGDKKSWGFTADGAAEGAVTFTVQLNGKPDSAYSIALKAVDVNKAENGVTYNFAAIPTLYSGKFADLAGAGEYAKAVTLSGKTSSGTVVTLLPGKIFKLISSNANIKVDEASLKVFSISDADQTATLRAYDNTGKLLCDAEVKATKGRVAKEVVFAAAKELNNGTYSLVGTDIGFKVKDQYGVDLVANGGIGVDKFDFTKDGFFAASNAKATVDAAAKTVTLTGTGEVTISYITNSGLKGSIVITTKPVA